MSNTLEEFVDIISANIGLDNLGTVGGSQTADQTLMVRWVNEAQAEIMSRTKCNVAVATLTLTANVGDYTMDAAIMALDEAYLTDISQNIYYQLQHVSPSDILNYRVGTQFMDSPPVRWYALSGANLLMVYPTPVAADILTFYYVPRPSTLSGASDTITQIPSEYQKAVEYYGCWQAGKYINDGESKNGETFMQLYEAELVKLKKAMRNLGGRRLSKAVVGNRRRPIGLPSQQNV